jgi:Helix-turn-helix domain
MSDAASEYGNTVDPTLVVRPGTAMTMLSVSRSKLYELLNSGQLASFTEGASRKITTASIRAYIARKLKEEADAPSKARKVKSQHQQKEQRTSA